MENLLPLREHITEEQLWFILQWAKHLALGEVHLQHYLYNLSFLFYILCFLSSSLSVSCLSYHSSIFYSVQICKLNQKHLLWWFTWNIHYSWQANYVQDSFCTFLGDIVSLSIVHTQKLSSHLCTYINILYSFFPSLIIYSFAMDFFFFYFLRWCKYKCLT